MFGTRYIFQYTDDNNAQTILFCLVLSRPSAFNAPTVEAKTILFQHTGLQVLFIK